MDNFDLRKYLTENKLTGNSKLSEIVIEPEGPTGRKLPNLKILRNIYYMDKTADLRSFDNPYKAEYDGERELIFKKGTVIIPDFEDDQDFDSEYQMIVNSRHLKKDIDYTETYSLDEIVIEPEGPTGRFTRGGNNLLRNIPDGFHTVVVGPKYVDAVTYSTYYDEPSQWAEDKEELAPGSKIVYEGDDYYQALKIYNRLVD